MEDRMTKMMQAMGVRPNFIVIHADQLRADCIHAYGYRDRLYTPNCDAIANQGARFDACYSSCPVCIPQRLSLLTGQSPQKHGVFNNVGIPDLPLATTLPLEMNRAGYDTALFGRTMHTYPFSRSYGFTEYHPGDPSNNDPSCDELRQFIAEYGPEGAKDYNAGGTANNSRAVSPFALENRFHQTMWATSQAVDYIRRHKGSKKPFMLFLGYYAPHSPHNPPQEWLDHYLAMGNPDQPEIADYDILPVNNGNLISPYVNLQGQELRMVQAGYYGNVSFMDAQIGRILSEIVTMPFTYVIFTSDHGEMLGDHYRMHKMTPYQGAVHTPLLIQGPGIKPGTVIDAPTAWQDLMPTILELAGAAVPDSCDGISLKGMLLDADETGAREWLHGETLIGKDHFHATDDMPHEGNLFFENGAHYLVNSSYKYIFYTSSGTEQLFDLRKDYGECHDLSENVAYRELLDRCRKTLTEALRDRTEGFVRNGKLVPSEEKDLSDEMIELCFQKWDAGEKIAYYMDPRRGIGADAVKKVTL